MPETLGGSDSVFAEYLNQISDLRIELVIGQNELSKIIHNKIKALFLGEEERPRKVRAPLLLKALNRPQGSLEKRFSEYFSGKRDVTFHASHGQGGFHLSLELPELGYFHLNSTSYPALGADINGLGTGVFQDFTDQFASFLHTTPVQRLDFTHNLVTAIELAAQPQSA